MRCLLLLGVLAKSLKNDDYQKKENEPHQDNFDGPPSFSLNSTRGPAKAYLDANHLSVYREDNTGKTLLLSFNNDDGLRIGLEWHRNNTFRGGRVMPDISYSVRPFGLVEVHPEHGLDRNEGNSYLFKTFVWSSIKVSNFTKDGVTLYQVATTGTKNGITATVSAIIGSEKKNLTEGIARPNGFKFSVNVTGNLPNKYPGSTWKFLTMVFSSSETAQDLGNNTIADGAARFDWNQTVVIDGQPTTIQRDAPLNVTVGGNPLGDSRSLETRNGRFDDKCVKRILSWSIPHFNSSFYWDPSVYVDENQATQLSLDGSFDPNAPIATPVRSPNSASTYSLWLAFLAIFLI